MKQLQLILVMLILSLRVESQTNLIDIKDKDWFVKIGETEMFTQDTLNLIFFKKLNSNAPKLHTVFAQLCYNDNKEITNVNFSNGKFYYSRSTFELCNIPGNLDEWNYFYDVENNEISIENENRKYRFKILNKNVAIENWKCQLKDKDLNYSSEVETMTLLKI